MNKNNAHEFLPLVQALGDGKTILYSNALQVFMEGTELAFTGDPEDYRIEPAKPRTGDLMNCLHPNEGYIQAIELTPNVLEALKAAGIEY